MQHPLWWEGESVVYSCYWSSPAQSFSGPSPAGLMTTCYCLRFETLSSRRARSPYLYSPGTVWPSYTTRHWVLFSSLLSLRLTFILRQTDSRPVCLGIKHQFGAYDQIYITVRQLRVSCCGALSLTRERVCRLQLLLDLASAVILGSESRRTRGHILLSQIRDFHLCRLLRPTRLRWKYTTPASKLYYGQSVLE
jgi:hypothetical protein